MEGQSGEISERQAVARQIRQARRFIQESDNRLDLRNRSKGEFSEVLGGVDATLDYVTGLPIRTVLDIGSGTTRAISQLAQTYKKKDLDFFATDLMWDKIIEENLGLNKTTITSVEVLRGFKDNSFACVLAVNSLAFSSSPRMVIDRIDQVLIPGGIFKSSFRYKFSEGQEGGFKPHDAFSQNLKRKGYKLALLMKPFGEEVVLAIKPGGEQEVEPADLLKRDIEELVERYRYLQFNLSGYRITSI